MYKIFRGNKWKTISEKDIEQVIDQEGCELRVLYKGEWHFAQRV